MKMILYSLLMKDIKLYFFYFINKLMLFMLIFLIYQFRTIYDLSNFMPVLKIISFNINRLNFIFYLNTNLFYICQVYYLFILILHF
jgi:hypothetical protein